MLQTNYQIDPIVEILRLAYRRGLVILREQVKETAEYIDPDHEGSTTTPTDSQLEKMDSEPQSV